MVQVYTLGGKRGQTTKCLPFCGPMVKSRVGGASGQTTAYDAKIRLGIPSRKLHNFHYYSNTFFREIGRRKSERKSERKSSLSKVETEDKNWLEAMAVSLTPRRLFPCSWSV